MNQRRNAVAFLPVTRKEMEERGWDQCDFVYVCGDAYVDHSSFGMAIITRLLEANGYKVGIIAQPDWHDPASIDVFGEPRLAFLVSAGNMVRWCATIRLQKNTAIAIFIPLVGRWLAPRSRIGGLW